VSFSRCVAFFLLCKPGESLHRKIMFAYFTGLLVLQFQPVKVASSLRAFLSLFRPTSILKML
jgi:hypothetical protein